jgi:U3 small nucleolar RNA-associated protein 14
MTLRHTPHNPWAKHVKQHGLNHKHEETRAAMDENCRKHYDLTRKRHSMKGSSSSDDSNDEDDDENSAGSDLDSKILGKLMKVLEEKDEITESRLSSLGFMVC